MTRSKYRQIAEAIGVLGVIGSLVFVGYEDRQSAIATKAETDALLADAYLELNLMLASSPELASALSTWGENPGSASPEEQTLLSAFWRALFHVWSNAHRQHLNGTLDPSLFQAVLQEMAMYARDPSAARSDSALHLPDRRVQMQWAWESERFLFNPEFQAFVDTVLAAGK
ncbi:MAG: hypothetical protein JSW46_02760 [Gemmatimonadota bacterium]|nr:MAG: hypothetical protein JSW46_02760 [Gemmatimonadota bacterium]